MRVYYMKYNFLPNKGIYNMLYVSYYTIYKQRKYVKMHPEYDANPVPYVTSLHFEQTSYVNTHETFQLQIYDFSYIYK